MNAPTPNSAVRSNPFATRFTRPGVVAPLDVDGVPLDLDALLDRLATLGGSGSIEGLHGRGKTTALLALAARAAFRGLAVHVCRVRSMRDLAMVCRSLCRLPAGGTLFIDGWESLGGVCCGLIRMLATVRARRLVVTSHRPSGLPLLLACRTSRRLLAGILARLPDPDGAIDDRDVGEAFLRHDGNLREALYDLYDRFERRVRSCVAP